MIIEGKNESIRLTKLYFLKANKNSILYKKKKELYNNNLKLFFHSKILKIIIGLSFLFILLYLNKTKEAHNKIQETNNKIQKSNNIIEETINIIQETNNIIQETHNINSREYIRFITCYFGLKEIKGDHRIRKYFEVLDNFVPYAQVIFCVSEYTKIDPTVIQHKNIKINIERYGNRTEEEELKKKYKYFSRHFYSGIRYSFYLKYLKSHKEIKYVVISDDDTLFFQDPFPLIERDPNIVHIMEDVKPFSFTEGLNYIWINAWNSLDKEIKEKCGFKLMNKTLLSNEFRNRIPLNSGLLIGSSENIIKIAELMSTRFICPGLFQRNNEQGLLNYLDLSGELTNLGIPIKRHNIYNDSIISCPNLLPLNSYIKQVNSSHFIALHHHTYLNNFYIEKSPKIFQPFLKKKYNV